MTAYAATTSVSVAKSKAEIEELLRKHGASEFASGWTPTHDTLQFKFRDVEVRFVLPRPDPKAKKFTQDARHPWRTVTAKQTALRIEQADRQRWRALYLVIRAKIEAVEAGIAIFEQEFLAFIVGPGGMTVGDILVPRIQSHQPVLSLPEWTGQEAAR